LYWGNKMVFEKLKESYLGRSLLAASLAVAASYSLNANCAEPANEQPKVYKLEFDKTKAKKKEVKQEAKPETKKETLPEAKPAQKPAAEPKKETKTEPAVPKLPAKRTETASHEYSSKVGTFEGEDTKSTNEELKVMNLQGRDSLRYDAGVRFKQQSDATKQEGSAFGSVYKTFDGYGAGVDAEVGNKIKSATVSGHKDLDNGKVRVSGYVGGARREDGTTVDPYDLETVTESKDVKFGGSVKFKTNEFSDVTLGSGYQKTTTDITIDGTVLGQSIAVKDSIDSKILTNYAIFNVRNPDETSSWKGGHVGVIYTQNENSTSEDINKDFIMIGGVQYKFSKRVTGLFTGKAGDQNGGGVKLVIGPDVEKLASLYDKLNKMPDKNSEEYTSTVKEIELGVRTINTKIFAIDFSRDKDTETNKATAEFQHVFTNGFKYKVNGSKSWGGKDVIVDLYEVGGGVGYEGTKYGAEVNAARTFGDYKETRAELILKYKK